MPTEAEFPEARVIEALTEFASLSDYCLVGGMIYVFNFAGGWEVLLMEDNRLFAAACQLLLRIGVPQFDTGDEWLDWITRTVPVSGGFLYGGQRYRFVEASCSWQSALSVKAIGANCKLDFRSISFTNVEHISDLEGRGWPPIPENGIRRPAAVPSPWLIEVEGRSVKVLALEIDCRAYHFEPATLNLFFQGTAQDTVSGVDRGISGSLHCRVVESTT